MIALLRSRRALLVLDNCEHLVGGCATFADALLRAAPKVTALATSRSRLNIGGETVWPVHPLALPAADAANGDDAESVRLFVERARAVRPSFTVTDANRAAVYGICRSLGGLPLALELAASWVGMLSVQQIESRLSDSLRLLSGGVRTAEPRQQTLRAAIAWSYDLIGEEARALLRALSVFRGGWTLEAAEAVCGTEAGAGVDEVLRALAELVHASLVQAVEARDDVRYSFLEPIRQYADSLLSDPDEQSRITDRHARWVTRLAREAAAAYAKRGGIAWLHRMDEEIENIRAALTWAAEQSNPHPLLELTAALGGYWARRGGLMLEGRGWLEQALARPGDGVRCIPALIAAAWLTLRLGDFATTRTYTDAAESLAREYGDESAVGWALLYRGQVDWRQGAYDSATVNLREAEERFGRERNPGVTALAISALASIAVDQGEFEQATALYEDALARFRAAGDTLSIAATLNNLGGVATRRYDAARAEPLILESLALARAAGETRSAAYSLNLLAEVAEQQGDHTTALKRLAEATEVFARIGATTELVACLSSMVGVAVHRHGKVDRAARLIGACEAMREALGVPMPPTQRPYWEAIVLSARDALVESAFTRAYDHGRLLSQADVLSLARQVVATPPETDVHGMGLWVRDTIGS